MREIYSWVPWFGELSRAIARHGPAWLAERARHIPWKENDQEPALLRYGDENIDPFSFIYSLAAHHHARERVYGSVGEVFGLTSELPLDRDEAFIFPTPPLITALFHNRGAGDPSLLWRLFHSAVGGIESVSREDFMSAQEISGVAIKKLTQALFLANAREFLPYDDWTLSLGVVDGGRGKPVEWENYRNDVGKLREAFPGCMPYEIDALAYETRRADSPLKLDPGRRWQISTNVYNDGRNLWEDFELNNWAYTGGPGKGSWNEYDPGTNELQYRVCEPRKGDILFVRFAGHGHGVGVITKNDYAEAISGDARLHVMWLCKRDEELASGPRAIGFSGGDGVIGDAFRTAYPETFRFLDMVSARGGADNALASRDPEIPNPAAPVSASRSLNTIFYGPPGTGKTYRTVSRCVEICDGSVPEGQGLRTRYEELMEEERIQFVTFHQSYSYEEFVEGIRPQTKAGQISYGVEDGILKRMAKAARRERISATMGAASIPPSFDTVWGRLHERAQLRPVVRTKNSDKEYVLTSVGDKIVLVPKDAGTERQCSKDHARKLWDSGYREDPRDTTPGKIEEIFGTGRHGSYLWIIYKEIWDLAYGEDRRASKPPAIARNFVLVIDEINRANISKVMGELITLLEEDKREEAENEVTVTLPYSREPFTLPKNLHILGTMNTADRSIALLDAALRRRFRFEEMSPKPDLLKDAAQRTDVDLPRVVAVMNERLEYLVDRDHLIGHAWFMDAEDREDVDAVMRHKIIPLIAEYFYDDWSKVRAVLGGTDDFVKGEPLSAPPGLDSATGEERYRWTVQEKFAEDAYERLVAGRRSTGGE